MVFLPLPQQVWAPRKTAHYAVDVILSDRLQDDPTELVFEESYFGSSFDPVFATEFNRHHQLSL